MRTHSSFFLLPFLVSIIVLSSALDASGNAKNQNLNEPNSKSISNWSIFSMYCLPGKLRGAPPDCHELQIGQYEYKPGEPRPVFLELVKSEDQKRTVAVVRIKPGPVELNPKKAGKWMEWNYGPIPDLSRMTMRNCEYLWGPSKSTADGNTRQYSLVDRKTRELVFLNVKFRNGYLDGYNLHRTKTKRMETGI